METKKEEYDKPPSIYFGPPQGWANFFKYGLQPSVTISQMATEVFQLPKKEGMPHFLEPFNESQQKLSKNI
jgi:hypothetical protein